MYLRSTQLQFRAHGNSRKPHDQFVIWICVMHHFLIGGQLLVGFWITELWSNKHLYSSFMIRFPPNRVRVTLSVQNDWHVSFIFKSRPVSWGQHIRCFHRSLILGNISGDCCSERFLNKRKNTFYCILGFG